MVTRPWICRGRRMLRLWPKTAFSRSALVHRAHVERVLRVEGSQSPIDQRWSHVGGKHAYRGRVGRDRNACQSCRSVASPNY
jgi:hypothetical protein